MLFCSDSVTNYSLLGLRGHPVCGTLLHLPKKLYIILRLKFQTPARIKWTHPGSGVLLSKIVLSAALPVRKSYYSGERPPSWKGTGHVMRGGQ